MRPSSVFIFSFSEPSPQLLEHALDVIGSVGWFAELVEPDAVISQDEEVELAFSLARVCRS